MAFYAICECCGQLVLEESRICPHCGARIKGLRFGESSSRGYYLITMAFVVLMSLIVVVVFLIATALR